MKLKKQIIILSTVSIIALFIIIGLTINVRYTIHDDVIFIYKDKDNLLMAINNGNIIHSYDAIDYLHRALLSMIHFAPLPGDVVVNKKSEIVHIKKDCRVNRLIISDDKSYSYPFDRLHEIYFEAIGNYLVTETGPNKWLIYSEGQLKHIPEDDIAEARSKSAKWTQIPTNDLYEGNEIINYVFPNGNKVRIEMEVIQKQYFVSHDLKIRLYCSERDGPLLLE